MPRLNSLRARLILLVALAITPMAAMTVLTGVREREHAIDVARENLQRLANLAAANEAQSLEGARQILRDLSSIPDLLDNQDDCSVLLSDILSKNTDYVNFGLIQLNGDVTCSAVAATRLVNLSDRAHFRRAIAERRFIASNYVFGRVIGKHTINLTFPVIKNGEVRAVLFAAMDLAELDKFVLDVHLSPGSVLWTVDGQGTAISRRPDPASWFGKPIAPHLRQAVAARPEVPVLLTDTDGVERLYAFARVGKPDISDYTVIIGMPYDEIVANATRDQLIAVVGLVATVTLALLAAWFGGDMLIVRRVQALARTANRIAGGSLDTRTGLRYEDEEIGALARSLDEMAQALQKKEQERDVASASLQAADRRKDEFLAMLAHELRNPLAPISSGAQVLKMAHADNPAVARTADIIARQVEHMTRLIDDLLDVSRVTRGLVKLNRQPLDLRTVVEDAVEQAYPLFKSKRQQLELDIPHVPIGINADHKRMVQVIVNLLNNAAKYTQEYGHIRVKLQRDGALVRVEVADDGIGMAPELVARVFELFTQAERTSDRSQGGLGLGLALARTLVTLHGGTVRAASAGPQQGSTFTVELPYVEAPALPDAAGMPAAGSKAARPGALRCLVVDDNVDAAQTLALFLEAAGHAVQVAHRAGEALELARRHAPELCFLDIGLPDIDGNQLARQLRALPQTSGAQLVAVTGYGRKEDQEKSIAAGFDQYFVKPMDTAKLVQLLSMMRPEVVK
ncbi:hybrid sensor histidine kinase/response regulator [Pseudoduganella umbonata]|uniref:histidine kinase n=2 Tax=Pseudoduganella umbonata TaxID=864828 RepID=A0A7W5E612_9BURK|nr:ATP-binding protein [Pseudoduganella umbonata]MBB3219317.1 signal transduction histidine kinase/ActR/RegA family two-component response regulator [Pseudoduganella umbonata]